MAPSSPATPCSPGARTQPSIGTLSRRKKPIQNGFIEGFNGRMRDELLNETLFFNLNDARAKIAAWVADYNLQRPTRR
ncbi:transposase InsO family protein [Bradyrhizobium sp. GM0.4]